MSASKRKSRTEMSDSDEYHSNKIYKELKRKETHKARHQDTDDSNMKNHKKSKKSSRKDDSFEDSGRESDSRREHKSSRSHKKSETKDEKYAKERRNNEADKRVPHKRNVQNKEFDFESKSNDSRSRDKTDCTRNSEKVKDVEKRKDKYKDKENKDRQKYIDSFRVTIPVEEGRRKDYQEKERRTDYQEKERTDYQEKERRTDYQEKERRNDYQEKERRNDYQEKERRKDYQENENEEYRKYLCSSRPKRKQRSRSDDELPVSRQEDRYHEMKKSNPYNGKDAESVSADVQKDDPRKVDDVEPLSKRQKIGNINVRTGGAYIPPARLRMMQEKIQDKGSEEYQRIAWEALKKSIVGMTNKVNSSNIGEIVPELFKENIIWGRGVLARAIMQAQSASPTFTRVYAALVAIINTKFPEIGELILQRLIIQYKRGFRRNDKTVCMTAARFIAHLLNQEVAHEVLILEIVTHLLENPSEDSVEVAISTLKECGKKLTELTARGMRAITQRVRDVLHEGKVDVRVRYMIEVFFAVQKDGFKDFEIIPQELDLIEEDDKYTHLINLDDAIEGQDLLNVFKFDSLYVENEEKYKAVAKEILEGPSDSEDSGDESDDEEEGAEETKDDESQQIIDMTETNVVCLRRKIYLTVQSSLDFEECAHKLLRLELKPGQILEMCYMILDCCAQQRTYEKFFGLLAQRFCQLSKIYVEPFTEIFENSYKTIHRLETNKLRNVAKFFAHLLYTDAISWMVLANIKLNEEDTTSSSRIFIKILFQELCEYMGLSKLNDRVKDVTLQEAFDGLFPRDHPHNTRFAINFFTSIGLGGLTDELREHLKNLPKNLPPVDSKAESSPKESSDSSSSSSSLSSSSSSSTSDSSSSDTDNRKSKLRKDKQPTKRK